MKKFTAIILSLAMLFGVGAVSASASEIGDTVYWDYYGDNNGFHIHEIDGYLEIGETTVYPVGTYYYATYELEVEESGCYLIDHRDTDDLEIAEIYENGYAYGSEECSLPDDDGERIYYLEKGTALFRIAPYEDGSTVRISPYGGERPAITYDADYYIESVEIENFEDCVNSYELFDGSFSFADPREGDSEITVKFKDGTEAAVESYHNDAGWNSEISVPVGDGFISYPVIIYQSVDDETGKVYFVLSIDEHKFINDECTVVEGNVEVNRDYLKACINEAVYHIRENIEDLKYALRHSESLKELGFNAFHTGANIGFWCRCIIDDVFGFIKYVV